MNRLRKLHIRALAITIMAMLAATAQAAVSFTVQAPRQVVEGNKFNVTFVLENAEGSGFVAPEVGGAVKIYTRHRAPASARWAVPASRWVASA